MLGKKNNGTTLAISNLIDYLREMGHTVKVVCPDEDKKGLEDYYIVPKLRLGKFLDGVIERNGVTLAKRDKKVLREVISGADAVHIQVPLILGSAAAKIAHELKKPLTASFHAQAENLTAHLGLMGFEPANKLVYETFYKQVYRYCDAVHYPTEFIREIFEKATKKTNAYVISNGVNDCFYMPSDKTNFGDKFTLLCTGRYGKEKDQSTLIQAVALSRHKDDLKLILAGDGPYRKKYAKLIEKTGIDAELRSFSREDMVRAVRGADLYVHSAVVEIEAIACLEAIVGGLVPIICNSPQSATKFFALEKNNLFNPKDACDLAEKIDYWYEHPEEKARIAKEYEVFSKKFRQKECMAQMEKMIFDAAEICKRKKG
ncbi:MAG: glycosyltransferase [Clostridia bacterium]|nr:glycosyltransferase [Clostridia bacterium]